MSLTRYDPFDATLPMTMRDAMERLLEQSFAPVWRTDFFAIGRGFLVDVFEDEMNYVVEASMPGVKPDELTVSATENTITIRAIPAHETKDAKDAKDAKVESNGKKSGAYVRRERYVGEVTRVIELPAPISPEKIKANYRHGVLTLEAPKAGARKPRKIDIVVEE